MYTETDRTRRVAEQIQRSLAEILQKEIADPRLRWVTVSAVRVSRDLANALVFYTILNDEDQKVVKTGLEKATGFLRHELSGRLKLRIVPQLKFKYDDSIEKGNRLADLIEKAVQQHESK